MQRTCGAEVCRASTGLVLRATIVLRRRAIAGLMLVTSLGGGGRMFRAVQVRKAGIGVDD